MNLWYKPCSVVYIRYVVFYLGFNTHTTHTHTTHTHTHTHHTHTHTHTHTHNYILYKRVLLIYQIKTNAISHSDEFNDSSPVHC